jgi:hypothetical protein
VALGRGVPVALSGDAREALICPRLPCREPQLVPTGAGEARPLPVGDLEVTGASFFPGATIGNERLLLRGRMPGQRERLWVVAAGGEAGAPRAVSGDLGANGRSLSPDGRWAAAIDPSGQPLLYPIDGGEPRALEGLRPGDLPMRFSSDGRSLFVRPARWQVPTRLERYDLKSHARAPLRAIVPRDPVGSSDVGPILVTGDGRSYVYAYVRLLAELYLVDGLR